MGAPKVVGPVCIYNGAVALPMDSEKVALESDTAYTDGDDTFVQEFVLAWAGDDAKLASLRFRRIGALLSYLDGLGVSYLSITIRANYESDTAYSSAVRQTISETFSGTFSPTQQYKRLRWRLANGCNVVSSLELTIRDDIPTPTEEDPALRTRTTTASWSLHEIEFELAERPSRLGRPAPIASGS